MNILASSNRQLCAARLGEEACVVVSRGWDRRGRARAARPTADGRDNHTRSSAGSATGSQRRLEALTSHGVGRSLEFQFQVGRFPRCPRVSAAPVTEPFPTSPNVRSVAIYFRWTESTSESDCNKVGARGPPLLLETCISRCSLPTVITVKEPLVRLCILKILLIPFHTGLKNKINLDSHATRKNQTPNRQHFLRPGLPKQFLRNLRGKTTQR